MLSSLTYIVLSTRGCSPRRPAAVISTTGCNSTEPTCLCFPRTFTGRRERTGRHNKCGAMPKSDDPISGQPDSRVFPHSVKKKRQLFPGLLPTSPSSFTLLPTAVAASTLRFGNVNPIPFRGQVPPSRGASHRDLHRERAPLPGKSIHRKMFLKYNI